MDVFTLIASYMPDKELSAQTIMRNITLLTFMIPVGIQVAATVLTGNNVGGNRIAVAKAYAGMCVKTAIIWAMGTIFLLVLFKTPFTGLFTTDDSVFAIIGKAYPVILIYVFFDCVQCCGQGIIRGLGKQGAASIGTVIGYWVLGVPIACVAVFVLNWGIVGLWIGPTVAIAFNFSFYYLMVLRTDWQKVADDAAARRAKEKTA